MRSVINRHILGPTLRVILLALTGGMLVEAPVMAAPKTDVVIMNNGDKLTGEIKELDRGRLKFKTIATQTIYIDWKEVRSIASVNGFQVELINGDRMFGTLLESLEAGLLIIEGPEGTVAVPYDNVVHITRIKKDFLSRISANLDFGFSYTQASKIIQYTLSGAASYRGYVNVFKTKLNSILNDQQDVQTTRRNDIEFTYSRILKPKRTGSTTLAFQQNDELGIALRVLVSVGGGLYVVQRNNELWAFFLGLSSNTEIATSDTTQSNLEVKIGSTFEIFNYTEPQRDLVISLNVFPSLTQSGRYRLELDSKMKWEIVKDFYIGFSVLESFDSKPPPGAGSRNDITLSTSIGISY